MTEQLKESLSAVLDDSADEFELRRVLDEAGRNVGLRETFERYQLVKSVLRGEGSALTLRDLAELQRRVRASLEVAAAPEAVEETAMAEVPEQVVAEPRPIWSIRAGIAAAVLLAGAAVWFVGAEVAPGHQPTPTAATPEVMETPVADGVGPALPASVERVAPADEQVAARHQGYLDSHWRWAAQPDPVRAVTP